MKMNMQVASLLIRFALGATFLIHGLAKFEGGIENVVTFFENIGVPGFLAYVVGTFEVVGGICVLFGLGTRVFAGAFVVIMLGAIATVKIGKGFTGGYEFELALLTMALHQVLAGSSLLAVDNLLFRRKQTQTEQLSLQ